MELAFSKMHGLGNDFVIIDCMEHAFTLDAEQIKALGDRHFGIGFDQMLVLSRPDSRDADVEYRIFNNDGSEVTQCGNGARCIAAYLYDRGIIRKEEIIAETRHGTLKLYLQADGQVRVNMGIPDLEPASIPLNVPRREPVYQLVVDNTTYDFFAVSMGNPHAVLVTENAGTAPVQELGPLIQANTLFPDGVNVGFMQVLDQGHIRLRVYERGAGETLACGSGACAAVVSGCLAAKLTNDVDVSLNGGHLLVSWAGEGEPVWVTGPATFVFEGRVTL